MKIYLKKNIDAKPIVCTIQIVSLIEAMNNCNMGLGTLSSPIVADAFISINTPDIAHFQNGEEIVIKIVTNEDDALNPQIVCCTIKNVTKSPNLGATSTQNLISNVFVCDVEGVQLLADGSICIWPDASGTSSTIAIQDKKFPAVFVAYSIVFSLNLKNTENGYETYYFIVDPLMKISSNR